MKVDKNNQPLDDEAPQEPLAGWWTSTDSSVFISGMDAEIKKKADDWKANDRYDTTPTNSTTAYSSPGVYKEAIHYIDSTQMDYLLGIQRAFNVIEKTAFLLPAHTVDRIRLDDIIENGFYHNTDKEFLNGLKIFRERNRKYIV
jgi:hypothetical protein